MQRGSSTEDFVPERLYCGVRDEELAFVCKSGMGCLRRRTDSKLKDFIDVGLHYALLEAEKVGVMGCQDLVRL